MIPFGISLKGIRSSLQLAVAAGFILNSGDRAAIEDRCSIAGIVAGAASTLVTVVPVTLLTYAQTSHTLSLATTPYVEPVPKATRARPVAFMPVKTILGNSSNNISNQAGIFCAIVCVMGGAYGIFAALSGPHHGGPSPPRTGVGHSVMDRRPIGGRRIGNSGDRPPPGPGLNQTFLPGNFKSAHRNNYPRDNRAYCPGGGPPPPPGPGSVTGFNDSNGRHPSWHPLEFWLYIISWGVLIMFVKCCIDFVKDCIDFVEGCINFVKDCFGWLNTLFSGYKTVLPPFSPRNPDDGSHGTLPDKMKASVLKDLPKLLEYIVAWPSTPTIPETLLPTLVKIFTIYPTKTLISSFLMTPPNPLSNTLNQCAIGSALWGNTEWPNTTVSGVDWPSFTIGGMEWSSLTIDGGESELHSTTVGGMEWPGITVGGTEWPVIIVGDEWPIIPIGGTEWSTGTTVTGGMERPGISGHTAPIQRIIYSTCDICFSRAKDEDAPEKWVCECAAVYLNSVVEVTFDASAQHALRQMAAAKTGKVPARWKILPCWRDLPMLAIVVTLSQVRITKKAKKTEYKTLGAQTDPPEPEPEPNPPPPAKERVQREHIFHKLARLRTKRYYQNSSSQTCTQQVNESIQTAGDEDHSTASAVPGLHDTEPLVATAAPATNLIPPQHDTTETTLVTTDKRKDMAADEENENTPALGHTTEQNLATAPTPGDPPASPDESIIVSEDLSDSDNSVDTVKAIIGVAANPNSGCTTSLFHNDLPQEKSAVKDTIEVPHVKDVIAEGESTATEQGTDDSLGTSIWASAVVSSTSSAGYPSNADKMVHISPFLQDSSTQAFTFRRQLQGSSLQEPQTGNTSREEDVRVLGGRDRVNIKFKTRGRNGHHSRR